MHAVQIVENVCCGASPATPMVEFLERKLGDQLTVELINLSTASGRLPLPGALVDRLMAEGERCLPAMVVDGEVVASGGLPNYLDVLHILEASSSAAS